jgi:mono/diheme cytochrome c family protein
MRFVSLTSFIFTALLMAVLIITVEAAPPNQSVDEGAALFKEKCVGCHTIGGGKLVGPDLKGVTQRREKSWLSRWILAPDKMLAEGDPIATQLLQEYNKVPMPNLGLNETQVASLIAYFEAIDAGKIAAPVVPTAAALPVGNAVIGKDLFTGVTRLQNGGPPCMGCHSIAGLGALGGGALGPDLTLSFNNLGAAGLASYLSTTPGATMNAVWARQPLMTAEQADLFAFLQSAAVSERSVEALVPLTVLAIVGALLLIGLAQLYWRKRLVSVRQALVTRSRISS